MASTAFSLYLDPGVGEPAAGLANSSSCMAVQGGCTATTWRLGILVRHTFSPQAPPTGWLAFGTGAEFGSSSVLGFGLYSGISWGNYTSLETCSGHGASVANPASHTMVEAGARIMLFPWPSGGVARREPPRRRRDRGDGRGLPGGRLLEPRAARPGTARRSIAWRRCRDRAGPQGVMASTSGSAPKLSRPPMV